MHYNKDALNMRVPENNHIVSPSASSIRAVRRGGWTSRTGLFFAVLLICLILGRTASAMFVSSPQPEINQPASPPEKTGPAQTDKPLPPEAVSREDVKLKEQIEEIPVVPARKRKVNSNTFTRMSGETERLRPVAVRSSSQKPPEPSSVPAVETPPPQDRILAVGSWVFIVACIGAMAIALFRIKKLASSD